jgi:Tfp pilus assembly protein FimV
MELLTFRRNIQLVLTMLTSSLVVAVALIPLVAKAASAPVAADVAASKLLRTYTTKAGDKLDRIIQKTMADSPLKIELLRQAFVELNPQAFPSGSTGQMRKGVVLQIPDAPKLLSSKLVSAPQDPAGIKKVSGYQSDSFEERRHWVRYP